MTSMICYASQVEKAPVCWLTTLSLSLSLAVAVLPAVDVLHTEDIVNKLSLSFSAIDSTSVSSKD